MVAVTTSATPPRIKAKAGRDDWVMRAFMGMIALYLLVALAFPLYTMLSKSFETYHFDLDDIEVSLWDGAAWGESKTATDYVALDTILQESVQTATARSRIAGRQLLGRDIWRVTERFRFRDSSLGGQGIMLAGRIQPPGEWVEVDSEGLRQLLIHPNDARGFTNFVTYFSTPALSASIWNSMFIAGISTVITVFLAFVFAYALTRSMIPFKGLFKTIAFIPILVPSLLPGISLIYLFGNQGLFKDLLFGESIYGPIGIVIAEVFFTLPHAIIIIVTALSIADARLYEAAKSLRASTWRTFWTVTLPGARYGLISAAFVVFTLVVTDFGAPKVIGGQYNVLAVDIYKQVIGQQNFQMGAVVSVILLIPAIFAFAIDRFVQKRQVALLSARAVPYEPQRAFGFDAIMLGYVLLITLFIVGILAMCQYAALVTLWPYNLDFGLRHYDFNRMDGGGWSSYNNSIQLALYTAIVGTSVVFTGAYMVEKGRGFSWGRSGFHLLAMIPMAVPGMVLGLAYIFFFNNPSNPFNFLYGTMAILVIGTVTHFYTVAHLTAVTALKQMDSEFEAVSSSLKQPFTKMFSRVTVPVCMPAILDIFIYLFVNGMTTVSMVVFLYSPDTALASVAALNMDDAGDTAPAAAMCMMIFYTNAAMRSMHALASWRLNKATQAWRTR